MKFPRIMPKDFTAMDTSCFESVRVIVPVQVTKEWNIPLSGAMELVMNLCQNGEKLADNFVTFYRLFAPGAKWKAIYHVIITT